MNPKFLYRCNCGSEIETGMEGGVRCFDCGEMILEGILLNEDGTTSGTRYQFADKEDAGEFRGRK